jgi:hypothetical protein
VIATHRQPRVLGLSTLALALGAALLLSSAGGEPAGAATATAAKKKGGTGLRVVSKTFRLSDRDKAQRLETICPKGKFPYGGGISTNPPPADGEGVYPNSFERLGVQHGYHINGTLVDVGPGNPTARDVTIQAVCGSKPGNITPPHKTIFVSPGETKTLTMTCPGQRVLLGGGHQRTTGTSKDGNLITESHAISRKAWRVTSHGQGKFGGEMTGIAYCIRSKKPVLTEVTATATLAPGTTGTATTAGCPKGRRPAFGGFLLPSDGSVMSFGGFFTSAGAWAASAHNSGPAAAIITAYLYCLRPFNK